MVAYEDMLNKVAAQVKTDKDTLAAKADLVLSQEGASWETAGKNEEQRKTLALRVAARQLVAEKAKLSRSGATLYEGMFVNVPREKDWAKMAYNKTKNTLAGLDSDGRLALVSQGAVVLYENNHDGTWTRHANPSLLNRQPFEEDVSSTEITSVPPRSMELDANTLFSLIWDKDNMHFANGNPNFKYGANRPLEEPDRSCLFIGRKAGSNDEPLIHSFRFNGALAKESWPTFTTGTIGMKPANRDDMAYGTKATVFTPDANLTSIFSAPPLYVDDAALPQGMVVDWLGDNLCESLSQCHTAYAALDDKAKWDTTFGSVVEVVHIDPRDNGGFIITLGDMDIMSDAAPVELYVSAKEEGEVDFGVGSELLIVGSPWVSREGENRFMVNGWWCMNAIAPLADTDFAGDGDGWDA